MNTIGFRFWFGHVSPLVQYDGYSKERRIASRIRDDKLYILFSKEIEK